MPDDDKGDWLPVRTTRNQTVHVTVTQYLYSSLRLMYTYRTCITYTALSQKLSESQHKNRVCHRWSKCNGKCLHGFWARNIPLQPLQRYKKSDYLRCLVSDAKRVFRSTGLIYLDNLFLVLFVNTFSNM